MRPSAFRTRDRVLSAACFAAAFTETIILGFLSDKAKRGAREASVKAAARDHVPLMCDIEAARFGFAFRPVLRDVPRDARPEYADGVH